MSRMVSIFTNIGEVIQSIQLRLLGMNPFFEAQKLPFRVDENMADQVLDRHIVEMIKVQCTPEQILTQLDWVYQQYCVSTTPMIDLAITLQHHDFTIRLDALRSKIGHHLNCSPPQAALLCALFSRMNSNYRAVDITQGLFATQDQSLV